MTLKTAIDLPSPTRVAGGLLSASRPLPGGWERGVLFNGSTCIAPSAWPYCLSEEVSPPSGKTVDSLSDVAAFEPTGIVQGVECTTLSQDRAASEAFEALAVTAEYQLGVELATGGETGNPNLSQGQSIAPSGSGIVEALATLENSVATGIYNRLAFIHVTWGDLVRLAGADVIYRDGRSWRTPAGNLVVSSPGYAFDGELHATAEVFASVSTPETRVDVDRAVNQSTAYAEQIGLAAFDPCFNIYVGVT